MTEDLPITAGQEIRHVIYDMYAKILKKIGFRFKNDDPRRSLMEKPHVVYARNDFLRAYMANKNLGSSKKLCVFVDETWIFANGSLRKSWQDHDVRSVKKDKGDGARYIVLHAGTEKGFIEGASLIFKSGSNKGDYHGEMNSQQFERWLEKKLLPALEEPSIIIMDNASYHSRLVNKFPTKSSNKDVMKTFLKERNVNYPETATKDMLWKIITDLPTPNKSFASDSLIEKAGHEVLRLPPYHCQFNPIEMVWSQTKRFYDKEILSTKDILHTWEKAVNSVTSAQWSNYVEHTNKEINAAWEKIKLLSANMQPLIISLEEDDEFSDEIGND